MLLGVILFGNDNNKPIESCPASHASALLLRQRLLSHLASDTYSLRNPIWDVTNPCRLLIVIWQ